MCHLNGYFLRPLIKTDAEILDHGHQMVENVRLFALVHDQSRYYQQGVMPEMSLD